MATESELEVQAIAKSKANKKPWKKKLISFLVSYFGLFLLLIAYAAGGALYFHSKESVIEKANYDEMMENHQALIDSADYLSEYLGDLHYSKLHTINNCTHMTNDPCYKNVSTDGYFSACGGAKCDSSQFCQCIKIFKESFKQSVQSVFKVPDLSDPD